MKLSSNSNVTIWLAEFSICLIAVVDSFWIRQIKQMEFKSQPAHNSTTKFELKKIDAAANS